MRFRLERELQADQERRLLQPRQLQDVLLRDDMTSVFLSVHVISNASRQGGLDSLGDGRFRYTFHCLCA